MAENIQLFVWVFTVIKLNSDICCNMVSSCFLNGYVGRKTKMERWQRKERQGIRG